MIDDDPYLGYKAYFIYLAVKRHFTDDNYDYVKYKGKIKVTKEAFLKRRDKIFFKKLFLNYKIKELPLYMVANFLESEKNWIGNLNSKNSKNNYLKRKNVLESLQYHFESDLDHFSKYTLKEIIDTSNGHPLLLKYLIMGKINIETIIIFDRIGNIVKRWDKDLNDVVWKTFRKKIVKYSSFLELNDINKFKDILKTKF